MSGRKIAKSSLIITLGIICILLAVGIVGIFVYYGNIIKNDTLAYNSLQSEKNSLQSGYSDYQLSHSHSNDDYNSLQSQNNDSQSQVSQLNSDLISANLENAKLDSQISNLNSQINDRSSQINDLNSQIANLHSQVTQLKGTINSGNLVTALGISEIPSNSTYNANNPTTFNHLYITGTVTNVGLGTAYNAGLQIVAYDVTGKLVVNITVPVAYGNYGTGGNSSMQLSRLNPAQVVTLGSNSGINIVHEGVAVTWKLTPVWTNSP